MPGIGIRLGIGSSGSYWTPQRIKQQIINAVGLSSIVAYYPMQEESGTVAVDAINGLNGTYSGVDVNQSGINKYNKSVLWNADTDYCDIYSAGFNTAFNKSEGTFIIMLKPTDSFWTASGSRDLFRVYVDDTNYIEIKKQNGDATLSVLYYGAGVLKSESMYVQVTTGWNQLAFTWSVTSGKIITYINAIKISAGISGISAITGNFHANYCIIGAYLKGALAFLGTLSHAVILNKAASETEVFNSFIKKAFIVFEGDSRTLSYNVPIYATDSINDKQYAKVNNAVSGSTVAQMELRGASIDAMIKPQTLNVLTVLIGINNYISTAQVIYDEIKAYCIERKLVWSKVNLCTEIDCQSADAITNGNWPTKYLALNTLIRNDHSFVDSITDLGAIIELQNASNGTYFSPDKTHPTIAGAKIIGNAIGAVIDSIT